MPNVFSSSVSRTSLGLADLDINDHVNFYVSNQSILSGTTQWRRNTVSSPYVESQILVNAVRDLVQDQFVVEVMAGTTGGHIGLQTNLQVLIAAFSQLSYNLTFQWDSAVYTYACQPSDYSIDWTQGRAQAQQLQVKFNLNRSPVAINGV